MRRDVGKPNCAFCEAARTRSRLLHRRLTAEQAEQAELMRPAIANYQNVKELLRAWEAESERLIDAEAPRDR